MQFCRMRLVFWLGIPCLQDDCCPVTVSRCHVNAPAVTRVTCRCRLLAEFGDVFATGISEVADDVLPGDVYCCVERIHVGLHALHNPDTSRQPQHVASWQHICMAVPAA